MLAITDEEIVVALSQMGQDKAPWPHGFALRFFQARWKDLGPEISLSVKGFFENGYLSREWNRTLIALIPKK